MHCPQTPWEMLSAVGWIVYPTLTFRLVMQVVNVRRESGSAVSIWS